ncbi:MAG: hypothetical protein DRG78_14290 [Epsilonproteobacteria bacterium]|nr:MAG: hypothetical protein DRG78_14290 [Campylobacterota bacterium]
MAKYLYGASVQGIQEFIFATNKLKEIVGASELVKQIATKFEDNFKADKILVNAAGNIKAIFEDKQKCKDVVLEFSKLIQQKAYGITISQAVVEMKDKFVEQKKAIEELEKNLKIQRNRPSIPLDLSLNIMKLNPATAKPIVEYIKVKDKEIPIDIATKQKLDAYEKLENKENTDLSKLSNSKNKLAVIHIDGNRLGEVIKNLKTPLSEFSTKLDDATKEAFRVAKNDKKVREIILGGDDVTVICDANNALAFTKEFLDNFEKQTEEKLDSKITACAGIAFTNDKYPFHYAVSLAEELCKEAKKHSKRESSCLMFHNIQSSNFQNWSKFVEDELTIKNNKHTIRLDFGAYYLNTEKQAKIKDFINSVEAYKCDGSPISRLRSWLSELYKDDINAKKLLDRINDITKQSGEWNNCIMDKNLQKINQELSHDTLIVKKDAYDKTPIYDILQILSVTEAN